MHWIIDLLIEKLKIEKDSEKNERIPLHIEDFDYDVFDDSPTEKEKPEKRVVIIDL